MFLKAIQAVVVVAAMAMGAGPVHAAGKRPNMIPREVSGVVNINTATAKQLELLPGVGKHTAGLIVSYREKTPFKTAHDIVSVKGVGNGIYKKIGKYLTIAGPTTITASSHKNAGAPSSGASKPDKAAETMLD
jgi:competence protein ComEA